MNNIHWKKIYEFLTTGKIEKFENDLNKLDKNIVNEFIKDCKKKYLDCEDPNIIKCEQCKKNTKKEDCVDCCCNKFICGHFY